MQSIRQAHFAIKADIPLPLGQTASWVLSTQHRIQVLGPIVETAEQCWEETRACRQSADRSESQLSWGVMGASQSSRLTWPTVSHFYREVPGPGNFCVPSWLQFLFDLDILFEYHREECELEPRLEGTELHSCPKGHPEADKFCYLWLQKLGTILMCVCVLSPCLFTTHPKCYTCHHLGEMKKLGRESWQRQTKWGPSESFRKVFPAFP